MSGSSEWHGETHTLVVRSVRLPDGPLDNGDLTDYEIQHPPSCKQETRDVMGIPADLWTCDVGWYEQEGDLPFSLRYSGTPITAPGTYKIEGWGSKSYAPYYGTYEYDGGVGVVDGEAA